MSPLASKKTRRLGSKEGERRKSQIRAVMIRSFYSTPDILVTSLMEGKVKPSWMSIEARGGVLMLEA